ncbi:Putative septation protein SpoVG [Aeoliella mucimassa]|uniref:Septation protein SpoVG n=1 Tax=Aeoliella mucimassa TaxID=2527972 RepID=A0A518AW84_9BACT|nr:Putative septation protein SpoVG [Aeoliella mucimassa]
MEITEVRIKLMDEPGERLKAFCSITFDDCFVIRDLKIIEGTTGPFVAMPSRKLTAHCPGCGMKNHLRSNYCNQCGRKLDANQAIRQADGRAKLYADIAHPINSECREQIQEVVIREFTEEIERSKLPGYVSRYDDYDEEYSAPPNRTTRVDEAHDGHSSATPHHPPPSSPATQSVSAKPSGGGHQPAPKPPQQGSDGFGAGIFGD